MSAILVLDTCAVLDLVRAPVRNEFNVNYAGHAREMLEAARGLAPALHLVVSDIVRTEFARNLPAVWDEALTRFRRYSGDYRHALAVVSGFSDVAPSHCVDDQWIEENLEFGRQLANDFMGAAATEVATHDDQLRAGQRVIFKIPPAATGSNNFADCVITEIAIRVATANNTGAPDAPKVVLFSPNVREFCDTSRLKPSLQAEFDAVSLQYVRNWGEAWASIR